MVLEPAIDSHVISSVRFKVSELEPSIFDPVRGIDPLGRRSTLRNRWQEFQAGYFRFLNGPVENKTGRIGVLVVDSHGHDHSRRVILAIILVCAVHAVLHSIAVARQREADVLVAGEETFEAGHRRGLRIVLALAAELVGSVGTVVFSVADRRRAHAGAVVSTHKLVLTTEHVKLTENLIFV